VFKKYLGQVSVAVVPIFAPTTNESVPPFCGNVHVVLGVLVVQLGLLHSQLEVVVSGRRRGQKGHLVLSLALKIIGQEELVSCSSDYSTRRLAIK
jgi:hypothetical protein